MCRKIRVEAGQGIVLLSISGFYNIHALPLRGLKYLCIASTLNPKTYA